MSKVALIVRDASGEVLYDTSKSVYGLIKSGPVVYHGLWLRQQGAIANRFSDMIYKFTVDNAVSPIVFTVGDCGKPIESKEGDTHVFYFVGPVQNIKVYCFDVMRPIFNGAALKTRSEDSEFTFNSLQRPLNVIGSGEPLAPSGPWSDKNPVNPFIGGGNYLAQAASVRPTPIAGWYAWYRDTPLTPNVEYAAHIPWSRGCFSVTYTGLYDDRYASGHAEGCSGRIGGIRHLFWGAPETTYTSVYSTTPVGCYSLTVAPRPSCSYIDTAEYPYPFNPQL